MNSSMLARLVPTLSLATAAWVIACSSSSSGGNAGPGDAGSDTTGSSSGGGSGGSSGSSSGSSSGGGSGGSSSGGSSGGSGGSSSGGSSGSSSGSSSGGTASDGGACGTGTALTTLPPCTAAAASSINVPAGCAPTVDGTYSSGEWSDAACFSVNSDPVYVKYAAGTLYLAWPMTPTCGCPAQLAFNTDGSMTLDGHQIDLGIFDDPGSATGDASEFSSAAGGWGSAATVAAGIVIANPPNMPTLVTYEIAIPFSLLGVTAGRVGTIGLGINHPMSGVWPAGLTVPSGMYQPANPADWGTLTSSANWQ
jgi:hypothetical protein